MELDKIKYWQWWVIGLVLGAICGGTMAYYGPDVSSSSDVNSTVHQVDEFLLCQNPPDGYSFRATYLTDIQIIPPVAGARDKGSYWVRFKQWEYVPAKDAKSKPTRVSHDGMFEAPDPFVPTTNFFTDEVAARDLPKEFTPDPKKPGSFLTKTMKPDPAFDDAKALAIFPDAKDLKVKIRDNLIIATRLTRYIANPAADDRRRTVDQLKAELAALPKISDLQEQMKGHGNFKEYCEMLKKKYPNARIPYRVKWESGTLATFGLWMAGTTLLVGGIWPMVLGLLTGAGLGIHRSTDDGDFKLSKYKPRKGDKAAKPGVTQEDQDRLRALEEELERNLAGGAPRGPVTQTTAAAPAVPVLKADPAEAAKAIAEKPKPNKAFGTDNADYYPTEIHGKK